MLPASLSERTASSKQLKVKLFAHISAIGYVQIDVGTQQSTEDVIPLAQHYVESLPSTENQPSLPLVRS